MEVMDPEPALGACCALADTTAAACCGPVGAHDLSPAQAQATASLFKALADPARVRLLNLIANADRPVCACELNAPLGLAQPTVSHHLKKLVAAGLLVREQRGVWAYYSIEDAAARRLAAACQLTGGAR